jgi:hypothetical protein
MERESFEDASTARVLNDHFVSIKVDREERPDVDKIYMTFVQATTGQGGWPLNVFLTPDRKPFYGGTYFPPEPRQGRPAFRQLLQQIHQLWRERQADVVQSATDLHERLRAAALQPAPAEAAPGAATLQDAAARFKEDYDARHGGFGGAPKFPRPSQPLFLLHYGLRHGDAEAVRMVLHTCERMAAGGICDQLGGGFARYAVDAAWQVPHFEKMLYDNAQLLALYLDAYRAGGDTRHADVARDIVRYVLRDLTHPEGGFYSAEDADSEGHEGKFYCWTKAELRQLLAPAEFDAVVRRFGITEQGNFTDHSHPQPLPGQNVLNIVQPDLPDAARPVLAAATARLVAARRGRIRPHLDDKILASWNGLMLGALAQAGAVFDDDVCRAAAERNLAFLQTRLWAPDTRTLYHRWRDGERDTAQLLDAYAYLLAGTLDLYETTLAAPHLAFARSLADALLERFQDPEHGGFWQSGPGATDLILRLKEDYDGAEPSGNSVAALALLRLAAITGHAPYRTAADRTLRWAAPRLQQLPQALPCMLQALAFALDEPRRVVITGDPASAAGRRLLAAVHSVCQPHKVVLGTAGEVDAFTRTLPAGGRPVAHVCTGTACQPPTDDPEEIRRLLR